jgi:hypothetical protein
MSDTASHSSPHLDTGEVRHTLSVHDVGALLVTAGVPRSHRQIIRYCETGMLDAVKVPGPTGAQWFVSPSSVPKAIGDLKQWEVQRAGQSATKQDVSDHVLVEKDRNNNSDAASHGAPEPAMSDKETSQTGSVTEPVVAGYVQQLQKRIEEKDDVITLLKGQLVAKDEQITRHSERERETNLLIRGLQNLVLRLQPGRAHNADVFDDDPLMKGGGADAAAAHQGNN